MRQLQLLLPGIRIWLDVVNLQDVTKLEESVGDSAVFAIFLSKGYFASRNCRQRILCSPIEKPSPRRDLRLRMRARRREVYAAVEMGKPIVAVIEPDPAKGGERRSMLRPHAVRLTCHSGYVIRR